MIETPEPESDGKLPFWPGGKRSAQSLSLCAGAYDGTAPNSNPITLC